MDDKKGFENAFGLCRKSLKVLGLWPSSSSTKTEEIISIVRFAVCFVIIISFVNISQTAKLTMIWGDLTSVIDNIATANFPISIVLVKISIFRFHKKAIGKLLAYVIADWKAPKTKRETENMHESASTAHKISLICAMLGFGSIHCHVVIRISQEFDILPGPPEKRLPMLNSYFPYNYKISPVYHITCLIQYAGVGLATIGYTGIYCLFVGLLLHLAGQVANLRLQLDGSDEDDVINLKVDFRKNIRLIVVRHQRLNRLAKRLEQLFNIMFLAELLSCTVILCSLLFLTATLITESSGDIPFLPIIFTMMYVMHIATHVFICCYVAEKLRHESMSICDSAYNFQWYDLPARDARFLMMIMHRAERPLEVTAGKFVAFSLGLYIQILKTSGGYLSMLLAVKDRTANCT